MRRADRMPRQTEIFTATDWAGEKEDLWCYVVQHRVAKADGGWESWESDTRPAHSAGKLTRLSDVRQGEKKSKAHSSNSG